MEQAMNTHEKDGELSIHDAVQNIDLDCVHRRVGENASKLGIKITDEHLQVIDRLIQHYQSDCDTGDCLEAHRQMRFLEDAYADKGGSKYLYQLFDAGAESQGVLHLIHELAGLPGLRLDTDEGFGTAF